MPLSLSVDSGNEGADWVDLSLLSSLGLDCEDGTVKVEGSLRLVGVKRTGLLF